MGVWCHGVSAFGTLYIFLCRYQLMQMCWQVSPGNRASLRELRIMLLHLHSASRGDPDTASFDQKWNQLMPRQMLPTADGSSASNNSNSVHPRTVSIVDIDLGTVSGSSADPAAFESAFGELNTSSINVQLPALSASGNHVELSSTGTEAAANEMSLATEFGALQTYESASDDDDNLKNMRENAGNSHATAHINVLAEVHCEKSDAQEADSPNVPLSESIDITDQFSSLNAEPFSDSAVSEAQRYALYLKTVSTSVIEGDDDPVDDPNSKDVLPSEALESSAADSTADAVGDAL